MVAQEWVTSNANRVTRVRIPHRIARFGSSSGKTLKFPRPLVPHQIIKRAVAKISVTSLGERRRPSGAHEKYRTRMIPAKLKMCGGAGFGYFRWRKPVGARKTPTLEKGKPEPIFPTDLTTVWWRRWKVLLPVKIGLAPMGVQISRTLSSPDPHRIFGSNPAAAFIEIEY